MELRKLLAGGVATIALAGASYANDLNVDVEGVGTAIDLASEQTGNIVDFELDLELFPSLGSAYLDTNQVITLTLNGATFDAAPVVSGNNLCSPTINIASGGGAGESTISVLIDNAAACVDAANSIDFDMVINGTNNTDVTIDVNVATEAGTNVGGGANNGVDVIGWEPAFTLASAAAANAPEATLASDFESLNPDGIVGTYTVTNNAGVYDLNNAAIAPVTLVTTGASLELVLTGDYTGIDDVNGETPAAGSVTITDNALVSAADVDVDFTELGGADSVAINGGNYAAAFTLDLGAGFNDVTGTETYVIGREGTDILFTYTLDDTTMSSFPGSLASYRISNSSNAATGAVTLQLRSWDTAPTNVGPVTLAASIPANGDLVFTPADVEALTGAYGIGDFIVNVEASDTVLEANYALINSAGTTNYAVQVNP